ncbi:MAG: ComEC/Rec2 family competence protein [bacterium]|nr:ComEC/Rec2 family competence protein [bacterium]
MKKTSKKSLIKFIILILITIFTICYNNIDILLSEESVKNREIEDTKTINEGQDLTIYYLDVGQADSILIEKNNEYMLIDAGNNEDGPLLVAYFKELGITKFKIVIGTHAHEDHIGGLDDIINNFDIENFYMPDAITTTKTFEDVLDALENKNIAFQTPKVDEELTFQDTTLKILSVAAEASNINNTSIVVKLKYATTSFLFMGDAETQVEKEILNKDIASDVLKLGHHGSKYSTSEAFLKKVSPTYAIISVGKNNTYNHPNTETINTLNKNNIKIYRTDQDGTIVAKSNGSSISFSTIITNTNG